MLEVLQEPIGQLLGGLVAILLAMATVAAGYGLAHIKKKLGLEHERRLEKIAEDAIAEVEEIAHGLQKQTGGEHKMTSEEKHNLAVSKIVQKATQEKNKGFKGITADVAKTLAGAALNSALGRLRLFKP